ncbi:MAG: hypothetical protein QW292_07030 [Candidatus Parvarchaeota archaeon]
MKRITISYTEDEERWINQHPEINVSALFRKLIDYLSAKESISLEAKDAEQILESTKKRSKETPA